MPDQLSTKTDTGQIARTAPAWPGQARWAAYATCVCTSAYGSLKLAQALGSSVLADKEPMRPDLRFHMLARDPWFVASYWITFGAAILGILLALATVRPWGQHLPRWILLTTTWTLGAFMILRAFFPVGFGFIGDTLTLTNLQQPPVQYTELSHYLARWDLMLWSPFFLTWGLLWTTTAWHLTRATSRRINSP